MPIRLVREGINTSPRINTLSRGAELFYRRLMSVVDDYGRFYASPATLRGACWPTCPEHVSELEVVAWLTECEHVHIKCFASDKHMPGKRLADASADADTSDKHPPPLLFVYEIGGSKFLQLSDFRQKTRSASRFPEPANQLPGNCLANAGKMPRLDGDGDGDGDVIRRRNSETRDGDEDVKGASASHSSNGNGHPALPSWMLDETYIPFADLARRFWPRILDEELAQGHHWYWTKLALPDRLKATANLRLRVEAGEDGEFVKHMPDYLKSEWKRGPKPPGRNTDSSPGSVRSNLPSVHELRKRDRKRDEDLNGQN